MKTVFFGGGNLLFFFGLLVSFLIYSDVNPKSQYLHILPFFYVVLLKILLFYLSKDSFGNIGIFLFIAQSYIRCVISPFFLYMSDYTSSFGQTIFSYQLESVILMLYEQLICVIVCYLSNQNTTIYTNSINENSKTFVNITKFNRLILFFVVLLLFCWFVESSIGENYTTVYEMVSSSEKFTGGDYKETLVSGSSSRALNTLFIVVFRSIRILFPMCIIYNIYCRYGDSIESLLFSYVIILFQLLFISSVVAEALIIILVLLLFVSNLYERYSKYIVNSMVILLSLGVFTTVFLMFQSASVLKDITPCQYFSNTLQAYVTGLYNVEGTFLLNTETNSVLVFFDTILSCVPFQNFILGEHSASLTLNSIYTSIFDCQIISTIGGGYYLLGPLLSPFFSAIFVYYSVKFANHYISESNLLLKLTFLYLAIQLSFGVGVYNIQITLTSCFQVGIPLYLVSKFVSKEW